MTLRDETEWIETVQAGWNVLVGADQERIQHMIASFNPPTTHPPLYGAGQAVERCMAVLEML